jgi:hypothetical protein
VRRDKDVANGLKIGVHRERAGKSEIALLWIVFQVGIAFATIARVAPDQHWQVRPAA